MILERLAQWIFFSVMLALLPVIANSLWIVLHGDPLSLPTLTEGGDVFLVAAALSGAAIGEAVVAFPPTAPPSLRTLLAGAGLLVLMTATLSYAFVHVDPENASKSAVAALSAGCLVIAAATGSVAHVLSSMRG